MCRTDPVTLGACCVPGSDVRVGSMSDKSDNDTKTSGVGDLRGILRQLVTPVIDQVETRVSAQIDNEVSTRIDDLLATRMATIDRAIGDIDRHLSELTVRLERLERSMNPAMETPVALGSADDGLDSDDMETEAP